MAAGEHGSAFVSFYGDGRAIVMTEHRRLKLRGSRAEAVYGELLLPAILGALAPRADWRVERTSEIEWEASEWVARLARPIMRQGRRWPEGAIIARGPERGAVLADEVAWLDEERSPYRVPSDWRCPSCATVLGTAQADGSLLCSRGHWSR